MAKKTKDRRPWPYSTGEREVNRVRVYDRDDSRWIQIEWYDNRGRTQRSLRSVLGEPLLKDSPEDRELARDIADRIAEAQLEKRRELARDAAKLLREALNAG